MKYNSIITLCLPLLVSVSVLSGCSSSEEQQEKYLNRAQEQYEAEDFKKARLELKNVLQINPQNAQAYYLQALMHKDDGNWSKMAGSLRMAVESDPTFIDAQIELGQLLILFGPNFEEQTLEAINAVLQIEPENSDALVLQGLVLNRQGDKAAATESIQRALASNPGNVRAVRFFVGLYGKKDTARALEIITEGISSNPDEAELKLLKIQLMEATGNTAGINTLFEQLIKDQPSPELLQQYALHLIQQQRPDEIVEAAENVIEDNPDNPEFKAFLVKALQFLGRPEQAESTAKGFIADQPDEPDLYVILAQLYASQDNYPAAETALKKIIDIEPESPESLQARNSLIAIALQNNDRAAANVWLAQIFEIERDNTEALIIKASFELEDGETQAAIMNLRTALKHKPNSIPALLRLIEAHQMDEATELAIDVARRAYEIEPSNEQVVQRMTSLLYQKGDITIADQVLEEYLRTTPNAKSIFGQVLFQSYVSQKRWDDALAVAATIKKLEGGEALGAFLEGRVLFLREDYTGSKAAFASAMEMKPDSSDALSAFVQAQLMLGETEEVETYLKDYIERYPDNIKARELLGSVYMGMGNIDKAIESLQGGILVDPEHISTHVALGQAYQTSGKSESALASYEAAIALSPDNLSPVVLMLKAETLESMGQYEDAAATYERLLAEDQTQLVANNNLAMLLVDSLGSEANLQRAAEITADFETSDVPTLLDTRGWVLYRLGKYEDALPLLEKAVASKQPQAQFRYHLGMTYYKMENLDLAKAELLKSLEQDADYDGSSEAREVLQKMQD